MRIDLARVRLVQADWMQRHPIEADVGATLVWTYFLGVSEFYQKFGIDSASPFFSPTSLIAIDGAKTAAAMAEVTKAAERSPPWESGFTRRLCESILEWNEGVDAGDRFASAYPDLFEPLLVMFEKGGDLGLHHGEVLIGRVAAIPLANWRSNAAKVVGRIKQ
jgi:hypothetical protein